MNTSVYNYYASQVFNDKLEQLDKKAARRNFAMTTKVTDPSIRKREVVAITSGELPKEYQEALKLIKGKKGELTLEKAIRDLAKRYPDKGRDLTQIVKFVVNSDKDIDQQLNEIRSEMRRTYGETTVKATKKESSFSGDKFYNALASSLSDIAEHKGGDAEKRLTGMVNGKATFGKMANVDATHLLNPSGKISNKLGKDFISGVKNISDSVAKAHGSKDAEKYDKAFKILMSQAYWLALYNGVKSEKAKQENPERFAKYVTNRDSTMKTWLNNTQAFQKAVTEGKSPRLATMNSAEKRPEGNKPEEKKDSWIQHGKKILKQIFADNKPVDGSSLLG